MRAIPDASAGELHLAPAPSVTSLELFRVFPPPPATDDAAPSEASPILCPVCGERTEAEPFTENVRESGRCRSCGAWNRLRQLALGVCSAVREMSGTAVASLADLDDRPAMVVYNTESRGPLHDRLARVRNYLCSEYFGDDLPSGAFVGATMHQDLMALSFPDASVDLVVSTDVFEHVADPYVAHREVHRVLRPGGHHVFTVPFDEAAFRDQVRASVGPDGELVHHLPPQYHEDPVRPEGVLVFTIFGLQMLVELDRLGFETRMYRMSSPEHGIYGPAGLVFDAVRRPDADAATAAPRDRDLTVVLPVHDDLVATLDTLESLAGLDGVEFDLVVVDDACTDSTPALLASLEGDVRIIRNREPLGSSRSFVLGAGAGRGRAALLVDPGERIDGASVIAALARVGRDGVVSLDARSVLATVDAIALHRGLAGDDGLVPSLRQAAIASTDA